MEERTSHQLVLLPSIRSSDWRLDEHTRAVGRRGVAAARAILRLVSESAPDGDGGGTPPAAQHGSDHSSKPAA